MVASGAAEGPALDVVVAGAVVPVVVGAAAAAVVDGSAAGMERGAQAVVSDPSGGPGKQVVVVWPDFGPRPIHNQRRVCPRY